MKLYSENKEYKLYQGNMLDMLEVIEPNSIDSIVTDPPYELNFMGKGWDNSGIAFQQSTWLKCLEVLKPGGYLLAFGGSRTYHRIACAIEDAGFEIRDTIMWLYGSGFPKSMDIGLAIDKKNGVESELCGIKPGHEEFVGRHTNGDTNFADGMIGFDRPWMHDEEKREAYHYKKTPTSSSGKKWSGWGTALKPSFEPIIVARKPLDGSCIDNVIKWGVGGINIDECRVGTDVIGGGTMPDFRDVGRMQKDLGNGNKLNFGQVENAQRIEYEEHVGRFPANTILTYDENNYEEVCGGMPETSSQKTNSPLLDIRGNNYNNAHKNLDVAYERGYDDSGSAARYFYNAKVSDKDEDADRPTGRFPANTILTYDDTDFDEVCGGMPYTKGDTRESKPTYDKSIWGNAGSVESTALYNDEGSASRYFYCAKASKKDRDEGLDGLENKKRFQQGNYSQSPVCSVCGKTFNGTNDHSLCGEHTMVYKSTEENKFRKNTHPTVKPCELMEYLVRLVTPNGGTVLDPFNGSGSTGKAVMYENREKLKGYKYIGIELTPEYLPISRARIEYVCDPQNEITYEKVDEETNEVKKVSYREVSLF